MAWDFETEAEFEEKLAWMRGFVREEVMPLETLRLGYDQVRYIIKPMQEEVRARGPWAAHLPQDLGGAGFGQVKLGLMHEILGQTPCGPVVFENHAEILHEDVRVSGDHLIGLEASGFLLARARLRPGRIHHCMRWLGQSQRACAMMCERALSRFTHGSLLSAKQAIQNWIADSRAEMHAARLMTLHAAWKRDQVGASASRDEIAMIKNYGAGVLHNVIDWAIETYGSLGYSADMPLEAIYRGEGRAHLRRTRRGPSPDGARHSLKNCTPSEIPTDHVPTRAAAAREKFADILEFLEAGSA